MAIPSDVHWKDLDTKGFIHVPGFLTPDLLELCRADYASRPAGSTNSNYNVPDVGEGVSGLKVRIEELLSAVLANCQVKVDSFVGAGYFATKRGVRFNWHQDHESFFLLQTHAHYLNLYVPIVKPVPEKSNLSVVPFDVLERESPDIHRLSVSSGATTVYPLIGGQFLVKDDTGKGYATRLNFDQIACTPQLTAGDALILRGDVFHKTQDTDTDRVAMSIRFAYGKTVVRRRAMAAGGLFKSRMMVRNTRDFARAFEAFDATGKDELTWAEMKPLMDERRGKVTVESPKLYLLKQKIRSRVLLSSLRSAVNEVVLNPLKARRFQRQQASTAATRKPAHSPAST